MFATVKGKWFAESQPSGVAFQYRKTSESSWSDVSAVTPDAVSRTYTAMIAGLEPQTEYIFRAVSAKDSETKEISFTTEAAGTLPNMGFDDWSDSEHNPNAEGAAIIWDSANEGTSLLGKYPTTSTDDTATGEGKAAMLKTEFIDLGIIAQKLAAGNIYTGKFGKIEGMSGASLEWGVPFTSRPIALKGWYKYSPVQIDKADNAHSGLIGQIDICQIQIMLTDWSAPAPINTNTGTFVDVVNDPNIIAYGKLETSASSDSYQEFTIKLDYRDMTRIPKYIVITACASKYGDYFTGGVGSTLYIDEFEFVYDPDELSE